MDAALEVVALVGAALVLVAGIGVLRFQDFYARMHAATKASTIGIGLIGVAGTVLIDGSWSKPLLAVTFIFVTAPSAAHFIARAAYRAEGIDVDLATRDDLASLIDDADDRR